MQTQLIAKTTRRTPLVNLGARTALVGLVLYAIFAPHSVAGSSIGVSLAGFGWAIRAAAGGGIGLRRSKFDLIIVLMLVWTLASSLLSHEASISLAKLQASWVVFIFYLTRGVLTKLSALLLVIILIASASVGCLYSVYDTFRGRGVIVRSVDSSSPFNGIGIGPNDTIWRVAGTRIYSLSDIDEILRILPPERVASVSIISKGEHVERRGLSITSEAQRKQSPSGLTVEGRNHRFRASGWTRHYQTFAEVVQMIALMALGLALAHLRNHGANRFFGLFVLAAAFLAVGIILTAMRTVLLAFIFAGLVVAWRSTRSGARVAVTFALFFCLAFGAVVVWQTRAPNALLLRDDSSSLRAQVAKVGASRIMLHPVFGHGMDAMQKHWTEWGFPGQNMLHLHSTPLQLAFDRGLPMLALWLWLMVTFWIYIARAESEVRDGSDTNLYGLLLGLLGALTGFLISSLGNYNYGDSEAVMLFWWLMGVALVLTTDRSDSGACQGA